MAGNKVAAVSKKALKYHGNIAFVDESGLMLQPLLRRSWAPIGQPPDLRQVGTGKRAKVSIAAAIWINSKYDFGLTFRTLVDNNFDSLYSAFFLEALLKDLNGKTLVIWDRGSMHKGNPIRQVETSFSKRLAIEQLPPYAPMLNPVEPLWSWLKYGRLCNFAPADIWEIDKAITDELNFAKGNQRILRSLFSASELWLPRVFFT
jgi:putative transposase